MRWIVLLFSLILVFANVRAQDVWLLYKPSELQESQRHYQPGLIGIWKEDFMSHLAQDERVRSGMVTLKLPLVGPAHNPFEFYSYPNQLQVVFPIGSVQFLDDLAAAYAYYSKRGCDVGLISDYVAVLRFRPQDAKGSPLDTLGVPRTLTVLNDQLALNFTKSAVFFIAAHEYAHVMYQHKEYKDISPQQAQEQENQADAFALKVMSRIGVAPEGMVLFFMIVSRLQPIPGDPDYRNLPATHPADGQRILRIAEFIEAHVDEFAGSQKDPVLWKKRLLNTAMMTRKIAPAINEPQMERFLSLQSQARSKDVSAFRSACSR
jgi:peptidase M48-like protein